MGTRAGTGTHEQQRRRRTGTQLELSSSLGGSSFSAAAARAATRRGGGGIASSTTFVRPPDGFARLCAFAFALALALAFVVVVVGGKRNRWRRRDVTAAVQQRPCRLGFWLDFECIPQAAAGRRHVVDGAPISRRRTPLTRAGPRLEVVFGHGARRRLRSRPRRGSREGKRA